MWASITMRYAISFLLAWALSVVGTYCAMKFARQEGIVDAPNEPRKVQHAPVPLLGGVAVFASCLASVAVCGALGWIMDAKIGIREVAGLLLGALILIIGGALDDRFRLSPMQQIWFPVAAALAAVFGGITPEYATNPFVAGTGPYGRGLVYFSSFSGALFTFFWLMGMTYTSKLLDGLDGLASGVGAIGAFIIFIVSLFWDAPLSGTSTLSLIFAGSLTGFLIYNYHPARIYLGEGGSLFIGFMLGCLSLISGAKIATALLIMGIPILDVVWVIVRRILRERRSPFIADRKHLHFRLLDAGLSHRQAVLLLWGLTALFGTSSVFLQSRQKVMALGVLVLVMVLLAGIVVGQYRSMKNTISAR